MAPLPPPPPLNVGCWFGGLYLVNISLRADVFYFLRCMRSDDNRLESCFFFNAVFTFKIKVSITYFEKETIKLSVIKAKLFRVFELGTVLLLNRFGFKIIAFVPERLSGLWKNGLFPARPWQ